MKNIDKNVLDSWHWCEKIIYELNPHGLRRDLKIFDDWDHHIEGSKTQHLPRRFAIYIDTEH